MSAAQMKKAPLVGTEQRFQENKFTGVKYSAHRCATEAPRSWLPMFRRVSDAQGYGQALRAVEALARGLLWRGQPAEQVHGDLVQLTPAAYRDAVLPLVHAAAVAQGGRS